MAGQAPKMRISQTPKAQVTRKTKLDCLRPEWQKKDRVTVKPDLYQPPLYNGHFFGRQSMH